jgi:hypothetical protein
VQVKVMASVMWIVGVLMWVRFWMVSGITWGTPNINQPHEGNQTDVKPCGQHSINNAFRIELNRRKIQTRAPTDNKLMVGSTMNSTHANKHPNKYYI